MTWTRCSGTRSTCSSGCGRALLLGPGAPLPPPRTVTEEGHGGREEGEDCASPPAAGGSVAQKGPPRLGLGQSWAGPGASQLPLDREEACSLEPQPLATLLLSSQCWDPRSPQRPLSGPSAQEVSPCLSMAHMLPLLTLALSRDPKPFLLPGLQIPALAPVSPSAGPTACPGMPGFHHCPLQLARMTGGVRQWGPASWCQSIGAKACEGPWPVLPPALISRGFSWSSPQV